MVSDNGVGGSGTTGAMRRLGDRRAEGAAAASSNNNNLPRCEKPEMTIPPSVPASVHSSPQIVIAHRGASAHLPEHSLPGYRLALELGADYIEPDLVSSSDGTLVAMHSLDLAVTTNVEEVFGSSRNKTLSKYKLEKETASGDGVGDNAEAESYGYWVYDFTIEELKTLRLKQRLGGRFNNEHDDRSTAFDGLFEIPTLTEILELLDDWNENIQPLWYHQSGDGEINNNNNNNHHRRRYPPPPRGLYAELKDFPWLVEDADINLVDLFFDHVELEREVWERALLRHMCHTKRLREHEYRLPPLVLQSFEAKVLRDFSQRWEAIANNRHNNNTALLAHEVSVENESGGSSTAFIPLPTPPTIVLVPHDKCREDFFWDEMGKSYRGVISGIGPDKMCFFRQQQTPTNTSGASPQQHPQPPLFQYQPTVMERATELKWVVHPWTERPEEEFFATTTSRKRQRKLHQNEEGSRSRSGLSPFATVLDEMLFLRCTVGVHGVFSESVDVAVRAMGTPCPDKHASNNNNNNNAGASATKSLFDTNEVPLGPVVLFSFFSGILVALLVFKHFSGSAQASAASPWQAQRRQAPRRLGRRSSNLGPHSAVPTEADEYDRDNDNACDDDADGDAGVAIGGREASDREIL